MKKLIIASVISASLVIPATAVFSENIALAATGGVKAVTPANPLTTTGSLTAPVTAPVTPAMARELTTTPMKVVGVSAKKAATKKVAVKKSVAKKAVAKKAVAKKVAAKKTVAKKATVRKSVAKKRIRKSALRK
jgi:hypothetical protein